MIGLGLTLFTPLGLRELEVYSKIRSSTRIFLTASLVYQEVCFDLGVGSVPTAVLDSPAAVETF